MIEAREEPEAVFAREVLATAGARARDADRARLAAKRHRLVDVDREAALDQFVRGGQPGHPAAEHGDPFAGLHRPDRARDQWVGGGTEGHRAHPRAAHESPSRQSPIGFADLDLVLSHVLSSNPGPNQPRDPNQQMCWLSTHSRNSPTLPGVSGETKVVKRRLPAPARRERIVAAALVEFAGGGYAGTSMGAIAERAGITRAVLYDHFASKQALYVALLEERNAAFLGHVGARITGSGNPGERMRETIETVFAFAEDDPASWRVLFGGDPSGAGEPARARGQVHAQLVGAVSALLAADAEAAGIDPGSREAMVEMLIAALRGAVEWHARNPAIDREVLVEAAMKLLWHGLGRSA